MSYNLFISAGEASGEHYGTLLVTALEKRLAAAGETARFFGMGGTPHGRRGTGSCGALGRRGGDGVDRSRPSPARHLSRVQEAEKDNPRPAPDVAVLIDFPRNPLPAGQGIQAARCACDLFVSPQLWAWKKKRIKLVQRFVDKMLVISPSRSRFIGSAA